MKQKLIALATQKGFDSEVYDANDEAYPLIGLHYYLWLCELQKHLRDEHNIYIIPPMKFGESGFACQIVRTPKMKFFKTDEEALEAELFNALKLIKG